MMTARAGRPLLLIDLAVPRDIDPACGALPGVTLVDIDDLQAAVARTHGARRPRRAGPRGSSRRRSRRFAGWLGTLEVLPTIAALREHGRRDRRRACSPRTRARWEALSERDRERVEAMLRAAREAAAARADAAAQARSARTAATPACSSLRELFGLDETRRRRGGRGPPPRSADPRGVIRLGTRGSALALAQARWVAERLDGEAELVEITTAGDRPRGRRQVALDGRARARAARRARSTSPCTPPRTCRASCAEGPRSPPCRRARTRATCSSARLARRAARRRARRDERRCGAARSCSRCGPTSRSSSCAATSTRGCASSPTARSTRSCSPPPGSRGSAAADVAGAALDPTSSSPRRGRAACCCRRAPATALRRGRRPTPARAPRCSRRARGRGARSAPPATRRSACTRPTASVRAFVGAARRLGVAGGRGRRPGRRCARERMLAAGAADLLARAEAMAP